MAKAALRLMSQREAAKFLGIAVRTLRYWDKNPAQAPPRRKIGKRYYYQRHSLIEWLEATKPKTTASAPRHTYFREQPEAL